MKLHKIGKYIVGKSTQAYVSFSSRTSWHLFAWHVPRTNWHVSFRKWVSFASTLKFRVRFGPLEYEYTNFRDKPTKRYVEGWNDTD